MHAHIISPRSNKLNEANELIRRFNAQLEVVAERSAELQHFRKMFMNHPDPQLRLSATGQVLVKNDAADKLKYIVHKHEQFAANEWWQFLVNTIGKKPTYTAEIKCGNKSYLLKCSYSSTENVYSVYARDLNSTIQEKEEQDVADQCSLLGTEEENNPFELTAPKQDDRTLANRLSALINTLQDGILFEDEQGLLLLTNQRFCEIFQITDSPERLVGFDCRKLARRAKRLFKDEEAFLEKTLSLLSDQRHVLNLEFELKDGKVFNCDFIPIRTNDGSHRGNVWVFNDISESISAKKALELQRVFYENILSNIPADIVVYNTKQQYQFVNPNSIKNPELRKWIIGKTDDEYFQYKERPKHLALERKRNFEEVLTTKKEIRWEEEIVDGTGVERVHLRILYPVLNKEGHVYQVIGYGIEITDRKYIEQQVKLSEKRYRELIQYSQGIIITHDFNGIVKSINPAIETLLEISPEQMIGKSLVNYLAEEDRPLFNEMYIEDIKKQGCVEGVLRVFSKSGKTVYLLYKNIIVNEAGTEPYVIGFAQDITERIHIEKELEIARQAAESGARAKERFLANMSHEIRTPMNGIIGISNLLRKTQLNVEQQHYLSLVLESANNLVVIINDILDLEKIIAGKLEFESIPFDLVEKLKIVADSFRYKAEEKDLHLYVENHLPPDLHVIGDPYRLSQILNNIISNAIKFTNHGEIVLTVSCEENPKTDDLSICYRITDTGIGISSDKLNNIFDPYVQERSEISRKYGGTGLGLAICKNLVELQGGVMHVKSTPGYGSSFIFTLPYKRTKMNRQGEEERLDGNILAGVRVLVAEDVEINQFLARHLLQGWNCIVTIVSNGKEAVREAETGAYDIILMDIQMPEMDGIEATRNIRKIDNKKIATIPIIALTANALRGDDEKYKAAGMNGYLTKPFDEKSLFGLLVQYLEQDEKNKTVDMISVTEMAPDVREAPLYDLKNLKAMSGGDAGFLPTMINLFITSATDIAHQMQVALDQKQWKTIGQLAHKIKPTIDAMGIVNVKEVVRQVEALGKQEQGGPELVEKTTDVRNTLLRCIKQLKQDYNIS